MNKFEDENKNEEEVDIVENFGLKATYYNNLIERYFEKFYVGDNDEQYIFIHTNG